MTAIHGHFLHISTRTIEQNQTGLAFSAVRLTEGGACRDEGVEWPYSSRLATGGRFFQGLDWNLPPIGQFSVLCAHWLWLN